MTIVSRLIQNTQAKKIKSGIIPRLLKYCALIQIMSFSLCDRGVAPIGRATDSKSEGWGFESLYPCQKL